MPGNRKIRSLVLPLLALGFLAGIAHLFLQRFEAGDVYPAYSSLRADPLGTKVLYESLEDLDGIAVSRNYLPIPRLRASRDTTLMVVGVPSGALEYVDEAEVRALEAFLVDGGRLVVLLYPKPFPKAVPKNEDAERGGDEDEPAGKDSAGDDTKTKNKKKPARDATKEKSKPEKDDDEESRFVSLFDRWRFKTASDHVPSVPGGDRHPSARVSAGLTGLSRSVSWHSARWFKDLGEPWRTVYALDERPVLIERSYGQGSIVLSTDSYFVSNEAMLKERHAGLLAWLVGGSGAIVFDETVHGIEESPGVASLGRKYRLHGLFAGIILLALLFVWRHAVSLVPPRVGTDQPGSTDAATGKDSLSGFVGLLRRTIAPRDVLAACIEEWRQTTPKRRGSDAETLRGVRKIVDGEERRPPKQRDPVDAYRKISTLLAERKTKP
jgi:hypothetical protein